MTDDGAAGFLTDEYLERLVAEAARPVGELTAGTSATVVVKVAGAPAGAAASATLELSDGVVTAARPGAVRGAQLTLSAGYDLARDLFAGDADPAEQYMTGDLKVSGDMALWLKVMAAWQDAGRR
ncbi:MAG TPA: hypothetical protein DEP66_02645 [Acidimicrobiaceae bacterium]|nr:hypothetical protein [Acidimicrobiaceae bacterium]HCB37121.1 hypothetical protein [Acidimicrobiaceae bacterium]